MAISIEYKFTKYKFEKSINDPISKESYSVLKNNKKQFLRELKKAILKQFNQGQGKISRIAFFIMIVYLSIGIVIPILAFINSNLFDNLENSEVFISIFGIMMLIGLGSLSLGFGYYKSRASINNYIECMEIYYTAHAKYVNESSDYESYLGILDEAIKRKRIKKG